MRDLAMLLAMFVLVPLALTKGFNAYLLWGWTTLLSPTFYLYGFMQGLRYNLIFAVFAITLWLFGKANEYGRLTSNRTTVLLLAFTCHVTISAMFGYDTNYWNWIVFENFIKSIIFVLLMPIFVINLLRLHALVVVFCLSVGFHGVVEGLKFIITGGSHKVAGILTSMMSDNNHFAVGMAMVLPLLIYMAFNLQSKLGRLSAIAGMGLTVLSIIGTNSRGGFMCLAIVGLWYAATSRRKFRSAILVIVSAVIVVGFAPTSWFNRVESIKSAGEDSSFIGRVIAWKISTAVAVANPIFGGGLHAIQAGPIRQEFDDRIDFLDFIPTPPPEPFARAAHSIYFEILGDLGFVGLVLFLGLIVNGFLTAKNIRRLSDGRKNLLWARDLADALKLSLVAYCVGGAGVSLGYFELFYSILMILEVLRQYLITQIGFEGSSNGFFPPKSIVQGIGNAYKSNS